MSMSYVAALLCGREFWFQVNSVKGRMGFPGTQDSFLVFCLVNSYWPFKTLAKMPFLPPKSSLVSTGRDTCSLLCVSSIFFFFFKDLSIYLAVLGLSCGMWDIVPQQGIKPGPLHWEHRVLATGLSGKSLHSI